MCKQKCIVADASADWLPVRSYIVIVMTFVLPQWCLLCVWVCAVHRVGHRVRQRNNYEEVDSF